MFGWLKRLFRKTPEQAEINYYKATSEMLVSKFASLERQIVWLMQVLDDERGMVEADREHFSFVVKALTLAGGGEVNIGKETVEMASRDNIDVSIETADGALNLKIVDKEDEEETQENTVEQA